MKTTIKAALTTALSAAFLLSAQAADGDKPKRGPKDGDRAKPEGRGDRRMPSPEELIAKLDKDGDKQLSLEELKASKGFQGDRAKGAEARFKRMDADGNGKVSKEEMVAARKKMAERRGNRGDGDKPKRGKRGPKDGDKPKRGPKDAE